MMCVTKLVPLDVGCTWPVYRGETDEGALVFVKVANRALLERTRSFLAAAGGFRLLPAVVDAEVPALVGRDFICLEWRAATRVNAEDMTDAQTDSLLEGVLGLQAVLARAPDVAEPPDEDAPERQYARLSAYAERHPVCARLLRPLLAIPEEDRAYGMRPRVAIHGDLQPKNYGFDGERLTAVYDFDEITRGLACEDLAYAFCERARKSELTRTRRVRLVANMRRAIARSPWPAADWRFAINHCRLRIAARRLEKRPDSRLVSVDVARRDRPLAEMGGLALGGQFIV